MKSLIIFYEICYTVFRMKKLALISENARDFGRELAKGVADFAQMRSDWVLELLTPSDLMGKSDALDGYVGFIAHVNQDTIRRRLQNCTVPIINTFAKPISKLDISVDCDHAAIARMAAGHFLKRGFRTFAYCGFPGAAFSDPRERAFSREISDAGHEVSVFNGGNLNSWIRRLPAKSAIFCANDVRSYHVIRAAATLGRAVPDDLAVLGSDNDAMICAFSPVPISSIDPNARRIGFAAARLLDDVLKHPSVRKIRPTLRIKPGKLIERTSTLVYPINPDWLGRLLAYIETSLPDGISPADIVAKSGYSYPVVEKAFKRNFDETIAQYLLRMRMEKAERLLTETNLSSKEIAARIGFNTPQHFCATFHRHYGHSPTCHKGSIVRNHQ